MARATTEPIDVPTGWVLRQLVRWVVDTRYDDHVRKPGTGLFWRLPAPAALWAADAAAGRTLWLPAAVRDALSAAWADVVGAIVYSRHMPDGPSWHFLLYRDAATLDADWAALRACAVEG